MRAARQMALWRLPLPRLLHFMLHYEPLQSEMRRLPWRWMLQAGGGGGRRGALMVHEQGDGRGGGKVWWWAQAGLAGGGRQAQAAHDTHLACSRCTQRLCEVKQPRAARPHTHLRAPGEASLLRGLYSLPRSVSPSIPLPPVRALCCASQAGSTPAPSCSGARGCGVGQ